jgi:hypothetical protein
VAEEGLSLCEVARVKPGQALHAERESFELNEAQLTGKCYCAACFLQSPAAIACTAVYVGDTQVCLDATFAGNRTQGQRGLKDSDRFLLAGLLAEEVAQDVQKRRPVLTEEIGLKQRPDGLLGSAEAPG